jgi:hypothetical protein
LQISIYPILVSQNLTLTIIASQTGCSTLFDAADSPIASYNLLMAGGAGVVPARAKGASMSAFRGTESLDISKARSLRSDLQILTPVMNNHL